MKMFLTRIGFGSKAVVTGDVTQIDLPARPQKRPDRGQQCVEARARHRVYLFPIERRGTPPAGQRIVNAYERHTKAQAGPDA